MAKDKESVGMVVNSYPTKHIGGFINHEIVSMLDKHYPQVNKQQFYETLGVNTCMMIDGDVLTYHCDVELAVRCCLENREKKANEWD